MNTGAAAAAGRKQTARRATAPLVAKSYRAMGATMSEDSVVQEMCEAAKRFLRSPDEIAKDIGTKQAASEGLRDSMGLRGISYDGDHVQGGGCSDRMMEIAAQVIDLEREIRELEEQHTMQVLAVETMINTLPDSDERHLLMRHYIRRWPMWQTAEDLSYSRSNTYDIHRKALLNIYARLPKEYKISHSAESSDNSDDLDEMEN